MMVIVVVGIVVLGLVLIGVYIVRAKLTRDQLQRASAQRSFATASEYWSANSKSDTGIDARQEVIDATRSRINSLRRNL